MAVDVVEHAFAMWPVCAKVGVIHWRQRVFPETLKIALAQQVHAFAHGHFGRRVAGSGGIVMAMACSHGKHQQEHQQRTGEIRHSVSKYGGPQPEKRKPRRRMALRGLPVMPEKETAWPTY